MSCADATERNGPREKGDNRKGTVETQAVEADSRLGELQSSDKLIKRAGAISFVRPSNVMHAGFTMAWFVKKCGGYFF